MTSIPLLRVLPAWRLGGRRAAQLVERNAMVYRRTWLVLVSGFFEPLFYLLSIGVGLGKLVGHVGGVSYASYVAPALLAASAMNGAVYDATFNVFHKLKFEKLYDAVLTTPVSVGDVAVGEVGWALIRGSLYATAFVVVMAGLGDIESWWGLLALPASVLIGFAFAAVCVAATTWVRSWQDFDFIQLVILPLFLFSATFYPLARYAAGVRAVVQITPLYHGVAMERAFTLGRIGWGVAGHALYLVAMGALGLVVAGRRLGTLLMR